MSGPTSSGGSCLALLLVAFLGLAAPAAASPRRGPDGRAFYRPPARLLRGPTGSIVWTRPANAMVALKGARRTVAVLYRSRAVDGRRTVMSASVAFPRTAPVAGSWRSVVWNHVTTGSADACAPTQTTKDNTERERMTRADPTVRRLLAAGLVVVRPDYEGIGPRGRHAYLIGRSLARSSVDAMRAARRLDRRVSADWAVAGHSEGGQGALFTGELAGKLAPELRLRAVDAMAPPTRMHELFEAAAQITVTGPGIDELPPLAALILSGAATAEPRLWSLYRAGALSPRAITLLPHVERRCFADLTKKDSWGGLAPAEIPGPRLDEAKPLLYRVLDANDPRAVRTPAGVPVRIDQGALDRVVPSSFTDELVDDLRREGADVTYRHYPTGTHENITATGQAAGPAGAWLAARLAARRSR